MVVKMFHVFFAFKAKRGGGWSIEEGEEGFVLTFAINLGQ